jgi:hypothetical protein
MDQDREQRAPQESGEPGTGVQAILSLIVVGGFVLTIFVILAAMLLSEPGTTDPNLLSDVATIYSGLTGAIIGYYFGKSR